MLKAKEVADILDVAPAMVRGWCISGTFPNAKREETLIGPVWLIPETDLEGFERRGRGRPSKKADTVAEPNEETVETLPKKRSKKS